MKKGWTATDHVLVSCTCALAFVSYFASVHTSLSTWKSLYFAVLCFMLASLWGTFYCRAIFLPSTLTQLDGYETWSSHQHSLTARIMSHTCKAHQRQSVSITWIPVLYKHNQRCCRHKTTKNNNSSLIGCLPKERSSEILLLTMAEITRTTETGLALPNGDRCALLRSQRAQSRETSSN